MTSSPILRVRPSHVLYSRESIPQETIVETFRQLVDGLTNIHDVRPMKVFRYQSKYWAHSGNRLLYVFRKLEEFGVIDTISVHVMPFDPRDEELCSNILSTSRCGNDVTVRGPGGSRMAGTLATIYRKSIRRRHSESKTGLLPLHHNKRSPSVGLLNLKAAAKAFKHSDDLHKPPPSPYPPSPALIEHALPYCVILFFLFIVLIFVVLLSIPL